MKKYIFLFSILTLILFTTTCVLQGDLENLSNSNTTSTTIDNINKTWSDSQTLFGDTVHEVKITLDSTIYQYYYDADKDHKIEEYAKLTSFSFDGETMDNVGMRKRGNWSYPPSENFGKPSFKVKFNKDTLVTSVSGNPNSGGSVFTTAFPDNVGRRFHRLKALNFRASPNDPCVIRERMTTEMFTELGVPVPRVGFCKLYINNNYMGIYTVVEQIDSKFLKARDLKKEGYLFKGGWPSDFTTAHISAYEFKGDDTVASEAQTALSTLFTQIASKNFSSLDIENVTSYAAAALLSGHWDSYLWNVNNDYLYFNPDTGKWMIIPWDMDNTLGAGDSQWDFTQKGIYGDFGSQGVLFKNLWLDSTYKKMYNDKIISLANSKYDPDTFNAKVDTLKALIQSAADNDPLLSIIEGSLSRFNKGFDTPTTKFHDRVALKVYNDDFLSYLKTTYPSTFSGITGGTATTAQINTPIYIRGGFNSWGKTEMTETTAHNWEITLTSSEGFTNGTEFKFDDADDWGTYEWGDDDSDGVGDIKGNNIVNTLDPPVTITFNDETFVYTLSN